jgi:2-isopropylmalate synthase
VLDREHGFDLPKTMHPQVGKRIYDLADELGRELTIDEIRDAFFREFVNLASPLDVIDYELIHQVGERGVVKCQASILNHGVQQSIEGLGNGPINAFVHALGNIGMKDFKVTDYRSHAVRGGSDASAAAYVQVQHEDGRLLWGAGVDPSIEMAGLKALVTAWNLLR